jgi:hypothetical protein
VTALDTSVDVEPAVRAKFLQHWMALPERYDPGAAIRLARMLGSAKHHSVVAAPALSWLPIELDLEVVHAVAAVLGPRFNEYARAYFLDIMPRPPLNALMELGTKLMGLTPEGFLRWWDKGWKVIYRGLGTAAGAVDGPGRGRVVHDRMPRICLSSEAFVQALLSSVYGVYTLTSCTGEARITSLRPETGHLEIEMEWQPRRGGARKPVQ